MVDMETCTLTGSIQFSKRTIIIDRDCCYKEGTDTLESCSILVEERSLYGRNIAI